MLAVMRKNRDLIEYDIATLVFYMQGGLNYNDAWQLTPKQRKVMARVIEKHYENMNPNKKNQF